ncbi:MAG: S41 family peptidase [Acidobacteriota bacterium]
MLDEMKDILNEFYYDPKMHGIDLQKRLETAKARVKTLQYNWQMYRVLVQVLMEFNDSHTRMLMPPRTDHFQYGLVWQMIGDECFITSVDKESNAAAEGIEPGDRIVTIGKYLPTRNDLWKINFLVYKLDSADTLDLKIKKPDGTEKALTIKAKKQTEKEFRAELKAKREKAKDKDKDKDKDQNEDFKCKEVSKDVIACHLRTFSTDKGTIDKMMRQVAKYPKFIIDLRGNGGGLVDTEQYFLSYFFDKETKIADLISKDKTDIRKTRVLNQDKQYKGEVAVLIDSNSASASEISARVLQIEKRAKIYGDYSSGSVMTSIAVPFRSVMGALAVSALIQVGMSVTVADVVMSDRSRLEHVGVTPDEVLQPLPAAYKLKLDAVLAYAAMKMGASLTPEDAGKFYFITEKDEDGDDDAASAK